MKRFLRFATLVCLSACVFASAHAVTPVAVWDGDFTKTFTGYTLDLNGNTASEGAITIASKGVKVAFASSMANGVTVIYKYAGMTFDKEQALATVASGSNGSKFGVELTSENYPKGIYKDAAWGDPASQAFTTASGSLALTYKDGKVGGGTYAYCLTNGVCTQIYGNSGLHESGAQASGVNIGGAHSTEIPASTGTRISAIAVFDKVLTANEMATYKFPRERTEYASVLSLNFGASSYNVPTGTDPGAIVDDGNWYNLNGNNITNAAAGTAFVTYGGSGNWANTDKAAQYLKGYLDENGKAINVSITNLTGIAYDVYIYCNSSSDTTGWTYKTVNGVNYTALANGEAIPGIESWGNNSATYSVLGSNVIVVRGIVPSADGSIAISSARNGYKRGCIAAVQIGERKHTAEIDGDAQFSTLVWNPAKPAGGFTSVDGLVITNTESATLTFDAPVTAGVLKVVNAAGHALKMDVQKPLGIANYDFSQAYGGITFDASGLDGTELAKNAVAGAPYTHWILKGTLSGGSYCAVTLPPVPSGYNVEQVADKFGVRIVVTAPPQAQFGSVNVNFPGGRMNNPNAPGARISDNSAYSGLMHGAFPIVGTSWNDVDASNGTFTVSKIVNADGTVSSAGTVSMSVSGVKNAYDGGNDVVPADRMLYGYIDDGGGPTFVISNIPFEKFRVIVYRSTDNTNRIWSAASIGATASNARYYFGPSKGSTGGATVWGPSDEAWGTASAQNVIKEGVNYVVSDVLAGGTAYIKSVQNEPKRGCVPGIQIVEVGKIVEGVKEYKATISSAGTHNLTALEWTPTPFAPTTVDNIKITISPEVTGEVVVNLDKSDLQINQFALVSTGDDMVKLTGSNPAAITGWDFSGVKGRVSFGFEADYAKVTMGAYPRIGIAYTYTGTIQSGFEYLGTGNKLTLTTINGGSVVIGGSGTLHGDLNVLGNAEVTVGGIYESPEANVCFSCTLGKLTIPQGADVRISSICCFVNGVYGSNQAEVGINGRLTVTEECGSSIGNPLSTHKGIVLLYQGASHGITVTIGSTGSLIAEKSWIQMMNGFWPGGASGYGYCDLTVDGGLLKARGIDVGYRGQFGSSLHPIKVKNGGTLQLAEGLVRQDNGEYTFTDAALSAYSYNSSTGYTWSPTNTTVNGTVAFDLNGLAIDVPGVLSGAGAKVVASSSKSGGMLTLGAASSYAGGTEINSGVTVKLGNNAALGGGVVSVAAGATLDCAGHGPTNAVTIAGAGVGSAGALVNTGDEVAYKAALTFAGDATVVGPISFEQGSAISLGGHALTVAGCVKLGGFAVQGGGRVAVGSGGTLASNGATSLGDADLAIGAGGTLDLSGGSHISCRDFASAGTVTGVGATLIVSGTFDATSPVAVPRLQLNAATLKGVGLNVADRLVTEGRLNVVVAMAELPDVIQIATVPESEASVVIEDHFPIVNGSHEYSMDHRGTSLEVVRGQVVRADLSLGPVVGWTNFEGLDVVGHVGNFRGSAFGQTNVNIVIRADDGSVITQSFVYVARNDGSFRHVVEGLDVGRGYDVSAFLTVDGAQARASSTNVAAFTARSVGGWINENAQTFVGAAPGTGTWLGTNDVACVTNASSVIAFTSYDWQRVVEFHPTNDTPAARCSLVKDLHYKMTFECPGLYTCEDFPAVPDGWISAITLIADDDDNCRFAIVSDGEWTPVESPVVPVPGEPYEILIRVECNARTNVTYYVVDEKGTTKLASGEYEQSPESWMLPMSGVGTIAEIYGVCQDENLLQVGNQEFTDFGDACAAAGDEMNIIPLWRSRLAVDGTGGKFRIVDNGLLELLWKKWHHYSSDRDGNVDVYRYLSGNNWIEYADASGVVQDANGAFLVTNEVGLAWIAESATNAWFCGDVTLGAPLDLSSKNWTPVARFSGVFDGQGQVISGLNNTNVNYDPLLVRDGSGYYFGGPTNGWGRMSYGLFAATTNAEFRNVVFEDVAISNVSEAVAPLLGALEGGDLVVSNVMVASGLVLGAGGGAVAGMVGTVEGWGVLSVVNNTNGAVVASANLDGASTNWVAGILTVGGTNETVGTLVVTGNVFCGTVANVVRNDGNGGNVAQILAGTTWGTKFGEVVVSNNVAAGEVVAEITDHDGWRLGPYDEWLSKVFPVCNLAPAVTYFTEEDGYRRFVEASSPGAVPVDPVYRTARMLAGRFQNGWRNFAGEWMDTITTMTNGCNLWITGEMLTNDTWQTVTVDRSIGFDLRGNTICTVYDPSTFRITHDSQLSISNGTILLPQGAQAFECVGESRVISNDINVVTMPWDFYGQMVAVDGEPATLDMLVSMLNFLPSGTSITMAENVSIDPDTNAMTYDGTKIATLAGYRSVSPAESSGKTVTYVLELNGDAVPDFDLVAKSTSSPDGSVTISLSGTRAGFYYAVQKKVSLVEKGWSDASEWQYVATEGAPVSFELPAAESSGFYRIKVTDVAPVAE